MRDTRLVIEHTIHRCGTVASGKSERAAIYNHLVAGLETATGFSLVTGITRTDHRNNPNRSPE